MRQFTEFYGVLQRISPNFHFFDGVEIRIKKQEEKIEVWTPIEQINQTIRNYFCQIFRQISRKIFPLDFLECYYSETPLESQHPPTHQQKTPMARTIKQPSPKSGSPLPNQGDSVRR